MHRVYITYAANLGAQGKLSFQNIKQNTLSNEPGLHVVYMTYFNLKTTLDTPGYKARPVSYNHLLPKFKFSFSLCRGKTLGSQRAPVTAHGAPRPAARRFPVPPPLPPLPVAYNAG